MRIYLCISDYKKCTTKSSLFVLIYGTVYYDYCVLAAHTCIVCIDVWFSMVSTISPLSPLPKNRDWSTRYLQVHVWTITIKSSFMTIFKFSLYVNLVKKYVVVGQKYDVSLRCCFYLFSSETSLTLEYEL